MHRFWRRTRWITLAGLVAGGLCLLGWQLLRPSAPSLRITSVLTATLDPPVLALTWDTEPATLHVLTDRVFTWQLDARPATLVPTERTIIAPAQRSVLAMLPDATQLIFYEAGKRLAQDERLVLWDAEHGQPLRILTRHNESISRAVLSPDGELVASFAPTHRDADLKNLADRRWAANPSLESGGPRRGVWYWHHQLERRSSLYCRRRPQ